MPEEQPDEERAQFLSACEARVASGEGLTRQEAALLVGLAKGTQWRAEAAEKTAGALRELFVGMSRNEAIQSSLHARRWDPHTREICDYALGVVAPQDHDIAVYAPVDARDLEGRVKLAAAQAEIERLNALINTPHTGDFIEALMREAAHQHERWAADDATKTDADWFGLVAWLGSKANYTTEGREKRLHRIVATAAAAFNWFAAVKDRTP